MSAAAADGAAPSLARLAADLRLRHESSAAGGSPIIRDYLVAGHRMRLQFAEERLVGYATALDHLASPSEAAPEFEVWVQGGAPGRNNVPESPWDEVDFLPRGEIRGGRDGRIHAAYSLWGVLTLRDQSGANHLWIKDLAVLPGLEWASPLRTMLFWWLVSEGLVPVHGAVVSDGESAVLLVGPAGSGKSRVVAAAVDAGMDIVADDYVAVETGDPTFAHSLYATARMDADLVPDSAHLFEGADTVPWDRKRTILLPHVAQSIRLGGVLVVAQTASTSSEVEGAGLAEVLRAIGPSTVMQIPGSGQEHFTACADLARSLPRGRLRAGSDPGAALAVVRDWMRGR